MYIVTRNGGFPFIFLYRSHFFLNTFLNEKERRVVSLQKLNSLLDSLNCCQFVRFVHRFVGKQIDFFPFLVYKTSLKGAK